LDSSAEVFLPKAVMLRPLVLVDVQMREEGALDAGSPYERPLQDGMLLQRRFGTAGVAIAGDRTIRTDGWDQLGRLRAHSVILSSSSKDRGVRQISLTESVVAQPPEAVFRLTRDHSAGVSACTEAAEAAFGVTFPDVLADARRRSRRLLTPRLVRTFRLHQPA